MIEKIYLLISLTVLFITLYLTSKCFLLFSLSSVAVKFDFCFKITFASHINRVKMKISTNQAMFTVAASFLVLYVNGNGEPAAVNPSIYSPPPPMVYPTGYYGPGHGKAKHGHSKRRT